MNTGKSQAGISQDMAATRLQALHEATLRLFALLASRTLEKDLLQNGIDALTSLIEARYGAVGLTDETGKLVQFIHSGITPQQAALIGKLPQGQGLLGVVIRKGQSLRLDNISMDPRSRGFPPNHPPMKSLLAVPIAHEGRAFGQIYLSDKYDGTPFHNSDETLTQNYANALALVLSYHRGRVEQNRNEECLREISGILSSASEGTFFSRLVLGLSQTLGVDYAFIGELDRQGAHAIHTAAVCAHGKILDNITYALRGTPCENVVGRRFCVYPRNVQQQFPEDRPLVEMGVESYMGAPLFDSAGEPIGLIALLHSKPVTDHRHAESILTFSAARAAAELERRRSDQSLRDSEENLRALAENANDGILVNCGDMHVFANQRLADMLGYRLEELRATGIKDLVHPDEYEKVAARFRERMTDKAIISQYETVFVSKSGGAIPVEISATNTVWYGRPAGLVFIRDISVRKQAEAEERKLSSVVEQTADSVVITDRDGIIQYVNPAYEKITGYTRAEAVGKKTSIVKSGKHDKAFYERLWQTILRGEVFRERFINCKKNGSLYHEEKTITPLKDDNGNITHFVSTGKDITQRMLAENENRRMQVFLDSVVENLPNMLFVKDAEDLRFVRFNRAAEELLGYSRDEMFGKNDYDFFTKEEADFFTAKDRDVLSKGVPQDIPEEPIHTKHKGVRLLHTQKIPIMNESGKPLYLLGISEDITERKRAEEALVQATADWTYSMDFIEDAMYLIDTDDTIVRANRAFYRLTGLVPEQVIGRDIAAIMHPQGEAEPCPVCRARRERRDAYITMEADHPNNPTGKPIEVMVRMVRNPTGEVIRVVMGIRDLSRVRRVEEELRASRARLIEAQRIARLGNWEWNIAANELHWSDETYRIFGLGPRQFNTSFEAFLKMVHPEDRAFVAHAVTKALTERQPYGIDHRILLPDGTERVVHEQGEVAFDESGKPLRMVGTIQDITERTRSEERLHYLAHYDALTGLPNRILFHDRLSQAMIEADRQDHMVAVMFIDLDRFKIINDTLGHDTGDLLLKQVAERLLGCLRQGDTISRLGGDEFTVILTHVGHVDDVTQAAQKIIGSFEPPFRIGEREMFMSPSIGITLYPFDDTTPENLLRNADAAMYHAKEMGRNTFRFYTAELNRRAAQRLTTETALRHALERNEFLLHYQPQVDLKTGRVTGMEALIRWRHPEMGLVPPLEFIPLAEETGLIVPIGEWVLHTACAQAMHWHQAGFHHLKMAVNLSGRQFQQKNLVDQVKSALKKTGLPAHCLDLELTESLLMHNTGQTLTAMKKLSQMGVDFSMDDFGTGYSSLSYLKRFPIDTLKIDRAFVRDITTDPDDAAIAQAIIAMSHSLGVHVIAEGVETARQLAFLRANRCDAMQGFYFSKPVSAEDMTRLLLKDSRLMLPKIAADRKKRRKKKG